MYFQRLWWVNLLLILTFIRFFFSISMQEYNWKNSLAIYDAGHGGRFARQWRFCSLRLSWVNRFFLAAQHMLKRVLILFGCRYSKVRTHYLPQWETLAITTFILDAVCALFRISQTHWDEFFNCVLRRSLTRMLCDIRRKHKSALNRQQETLEDGRPISPSSRRCAATDSGPNPFNAWSIKAAD